MAMSRGVVAGPNLRTLAAAPAVTGASIEGADVRRIVVSMWTTLDGCVAGPRDEMDWLAIDEYHLLVHPTAIGRGKALFATATELLLRSVETFPTGAVLMRYTHAA